MLLQVRLLGLLLRPKPHINQTPGGEVILLWKETKEADYVFTAESQHSLVLL